MKRFFQVFLVLSLAMLVFTGLAFVASAAEVSENASNAYWRLEQGDTVKYFPTLSEAIAAITADGATVTLQKDTAESAPSLNVAYTYTVDGNGNTLTSTYVKHNVTGGTGNNTLFHICNGKPTVKNLTIAAAKKPSTWIYVQNANGTAAANVAEVDVTLENVVCESESTHGIILNQPATLTITGDGSKYEGSANDIVRAQSTALRSVITINGGTFHATSAVLRPMTSGIKATINGGSFTTGNKFVYFNGDATSGRRTSVTINDGLFDYTGTTTTRLLFHIAGEYTDLIFPKDSTAIVKAGVAQSVFSSDSTDYSISVENGLFVMGTQNYLLKASKATVDGAIILFSTVDANNQFAITSTELVTSDTNTPTVFYGGNEYKLYMKTQTNATADIVTADTVGASVYLGGTEATSGLRFTSYLSGSIIALAKQALESNKTVSYGTLIAPADHVAKAGGFTKKNLDTLLVAQGTVAYVDVPAVYSTRDGDGDGVFESFSASLINIKEGNFNRAFAAIAYVTIDGVTYYSDYNTVDNARSISEIAANFLAAGTYENNTEVLALLNKYANANEGLAFDPARESVSVEKLDSASSYTILFIGNSYTKSNDLAGTVFPAIAQSAGYDFTVVKAVRDSWYLIQSADPTDINGAKVDAAFSNYDVDFVVMQEQSTCSILNPGKFYDGARAINELAAAEGATPVFYGTWGRKTGHSFLTNNNLTTESMMWTIAAAYAAIGEELGIPVSNVGMAFYDVYANYPSINLYNDDLHHPSYAGTYLAAMTIFARLTGTDPTTIAYNGDGTITDDQAAVLKEAARKAVFEPAVIPEAYQTSSVGVHEEKHVDYTEMVNVTTLPTSSIITVQQNGSSYSGITGTKGEVASTAYSSSGLSDTQKADVADIGYGISVIGIEKMADGCETAVSNLINGQWATSANSGKFTFDDKKYDVNGNVDETGLYSCLITLNFGSKHTFDTIGFCSGDMKGFPGAAEVFVSDDGVNWTRVPTACWDKIYGNAYSGCSSNPTDFAGGTSSGKTCLFSMNGTSGQYIRMGIAIGRNDAPEYYNTISTRELIVYGEKAAAES